MLIVLVQGSWQMQTSFFFLSYRKEDEAEWFPEDFKRVCELFGGLFFH